MGRQNKMSMRRGTTLFLAAGISSVGLWLYSQRSMPYGFGMVAIALVVAGAAVVKFAGRASMASSNARSGDPTGDYVLYLRSFWDDALGASIGANGAFEAQEPHLLRQIERLGTPCLVEPPTLRLPRDVIGHRLRIKPKEPGDHTWLERVTRLALGASHVVAQIGKTEGLHQEIRMLCERNFFTKTLIVIPDSMRTGIRLVQIDERWELLVEWLEPYPAARPDDLAQCVGRQLAGVFWGDRLDNASVVMVPGSYAGTGTYEVAVSTYIEAKGLVDRAPLEKRSVPGRLALGLFAVAVGLVSAWIYRLGDHFARESAIGFLGSVLCFVLGLLAMDRSQPRSWRFWKVLRGDGRFDDAFLLCCYYSFLALSLAHGGE